MLFIDDCTRISWVYLNKNLISEIFVNLAKMVLTQFQTQIQVLRSDNDGEYINNDMKQYFTHHGLIYQTTCIDTPQLNGVVERKNYTLLEITSAIMFEFIVPSHLWP